MNTQVLRVVTRASALALRQAEESQRVLEAAFPRAKVVLLPMKTSGDRQLGWSLEKKGGKGLFTKELEDALLAGQADVAIHSAKDLPTTMPEGLALAGCLPRAEARDVLVLREGVATPRHLATGSPRRRQQASLFFSDVSWSEIRGNVETRLRKIARGDADGTFMAAAGLGRLGITAWEGLRLERLDLRRMVPAAGQGAIAWQTRVQDAPTLAHLLCARTTCAVLAERAFLASLGGGCHSAVAAHWDGTVFHVYDEARGYRSCAAPDDAALPQALEWLTSSAS